MHAAKSLGILFVILMLNGCQPYKANTYRGTAQVSSAGNAATSDGSSGKPAIPTDKQTEVVLAGNKLKAGSGSYKAVIRYLNSELNQDFSPTGTEIRLLAPSLPANDVGVMQVEIFQDGKLKFIAKRANTKLDKAQANRIIIDDCLILPAPWDGNQHDGSCEWSIAEK